MTNLTDQMKRIKPGWLFYAGIAGLILFECLNIYFIMPFPGSQRINSLDLAYFLYSKRWLFRSGLALLIITGFPFILKMNRRWWIPVVSMAAAAAVTTVINVRMTADKMFRQAKDLHFSSSADNKLPVESIVIVVAEADEVKGYPVRYISYHHQVVDTIGGQPRMITYCNVCRTGRTYEPKVKGNPEQFRLVGMDHFNAMFEDATTGSWWRQVSGEAVEGPLKGEKLNDIFCRQMTIEQLFRQYPDAVVMQADENYKEKYDTLGKFEEGRSESHLTRTDTTSWKDKSWVIGLEYHDDSKAYDWNELKKRRVINDQIGDVPVAIVLSADGNSFFAFERDALYENMTLSNDTIFYRNRAYDITGRPLADASGNLVLISAFQEFWHSWRTFHPFTMQYP